MDSSGAVVALLAEGVDRNIPISRMFDYVSVALLAEGVDRNNFDELFVYISLILSPSSRRAWIEISVPFIFTVSE